MSPTEIAYRVGRALGVRLEQAQLSHVRSMPRPNLSMRPVGWIAPIPAIQPQSYLTAAERLARGRFDVFTMLDVDLGTPPRWNRDPKTGIEAPLQFGKRLDYRDTHLVGDIKYLWEPNRHLHLVTLAQAHALTSGSPSRISTHLGVIRTHLQSWFDACPTGQGANWSSALELALRLINWSLCWQLIGGIESPLFAGAEGRLVRSRWLASIYDHQRHIAGHFSLHSSANNHLIGEASGLFIAAVTWPQWQQSPRWQGTAKAILEREVQLQNGDDGVNREQAVAYQQFELELLILSLIAGNANGSAFSATYRGRIESMIGYLAAIMDCAGNIPMIGDADDGQAVRLNPARDGDQLRALMGLGSILFRRADFKIKAGSLDDNARWLLGQRADEIFDALSPNDVTHPLQGSFPIGGYYILGRDFGSRDEIRLIADAGPLGYQRIAAHGHADALSFTLSLGGHEVFIDPGTYAYHGDRYWRDYFRGTSAHNTVRIDEIDQSESGGNFLWLTHAKAVCVVWESTPEQDVFEGWHDGYQRLSDPVRHTRRIVLNKASRMILIEDRLSMRGTHLIELNFHLSDQCTVRSLGRSYAITCGRKTIVLGLPASHGDGAAASELIYCGNAEVPSGWISRQFDSKVPAPTIRWCERIHGSVVLCSTIFC
jgi:hypothetical protein